MLAVTSYNVMVPGNSVGGPLAFDPVAECYKRLTMNWVARNSESFNLGMLLGIKGVPSMLPAFLVIATLIVVVSRRAVSGSAIPSAQAQDDQQQDGQDHQRRRDSYEA
jgi:hypothetical protein